MKNTLLLLLAACAVNVLQNHSAFAACAIVFGSETTQTHDVPAYPVNTFAYTVDFPNDTDCPTATGVSSGVRETGHQEYLRHQMCVRTDTITTYLEADPCDPNANCPPYQTQTRGNPVCQDEGIIEGHFYCGQAVNA